MDVNEMRAAALRRLARETPRAVVLDAEHLSMLAGALTLYRRKGEADLGVGPSMRFDHERAVDDLAAHLGVTLGQWEQVATAPSTEVARPAGPAVVDVEPAPLVIEPDERTYFQADWDDDGSADEDDGAAESRDALENVHEMLEG